MRLKCSVRRKYMEEAEFFSGKCGHKGGCYYPELAEYEKQCDSIWAAWHKAGSKGKSPVMPPAIVECEKCPYADLTVGGFEGYANSRVIERFRDGTVPVPIKGRKKVYIDNVNQTQLNSLIEDFDEDLEAFAISGSPKISDFSFLERFPKLKKVYIWWNNDLEHLWDFTKTPKIEYLHLDGFSRLSDFSPLKDAVNLRYLYAYCNWIDSLKPLENHPSLEYVELSARLKEESIDPLISMPSLKYLDLHFNILEIDEYAKFEAKRPDVDTSFFEGINGCDDGEDEFWGIWVFSVGKRQRSILADDEKLEAKMNKQKLKYLAVKEKYLNGQNG